MQNLELVNLKCVTYAQTIPLSLSFALYSTILNFHVFVSAQFLFHAC